MVEAETSEQPSATEVLVAKSEAVKDVDRARGFLDFAANEFGEAGEAEAQRAVVGLIASIDELFRTLAESVQS